MSDHVHGNGDDIENAIAAYVLDAAETQEAATIAAHLESCASCRELERRLRRVAAMLPLSTDEEAPPPRLRDRILVAAGAHQVPPPLPRRVLRPPHSAGRRHRFTRRAGVAGLVASLLTLVGWNAYLTLQLGRAQAAATSHQMTALSPTLARSNGQVVALPNQRLLLVDFKRMPEPPPGTVYELWLGMGTGRMVPAGIFRPDPDGSKLLLLNRELSPYSVIAVTVEPGPDGTPSPTQSPGMAGSI